MGTNPQNVLKWISWHQNELTPGTSMSPNIWLILPPLWTHGYNGATSCPRHIQYMTKSTKSARV